MAMASALRRVASAAALRRRAIPTFIFGRANHQQAPGGIVEEAEIVSNYPQEEQHFEEFPQENGQFQHEQYQYNEHQYAPPAQEEYYVPPPPPPPPPPPQIFDNTDVPITLVLMGRSMQLKFQSQKDFDMLLDKTSGFGVMLPDEPGNITRKLCELDPKKVYVLVDSKAVLKQTKKMAKEEAEREGYPPDFMNMLSRNKYGKYVSDDEED